MSTFVADGNTECGQNVGEETIARMCLVDPEVAMRLCKTLSHQLSGAAMSTVVEGNRRILDIWTFGPVSCAG